MNKIKELETKISAAQEAYYNGSEIMSDDEYDAYVVPTLHLLEQGAPFHTFKSYISHVVHHDMGLEGIIDDVALDDFVLKAYDVNTNEDK